jgi:hypothetical protein
VYIINEIENTLPAHAQPTNVKAVLMRSLNIKAMTEIIIEEVDEEYYSITAPSGLQSSFVALAVYPSPQAMTVFVHKNWSPRGQGTNIRDGIIWSL